LDYELVRITPEEINQLNILKSRMEGFRRAIGILANSTGATYAIIDGDKKPADLNIETDFLIKADALLPGVSCASIIAKHSHTVYMTELSKLEPYSKYGFEKHKAYGTKIHMDALKEHGPIPGFHRYSFQPIKDSIKTKKPKI
jgi:ribonuclease HII